MDAADTVVSREGFLYSAVTVQVTRARRGNDDLSSGRLGGAQQTTPALGR